MSTVDAQPRWGIAVTSDSNASRGQLSSSYGDDRVYYQALMLQEVFKNSRVSERMQSVLVNLRGRQRPR